jgi:hypothetical protein
MCPLRVHRCPLYINYFLLHEDEHGLKIAPCHTSTTITRDTHVANREISSGCQQREKLRLPTERKARVANREQSAGCQQRAKLRLPTEKKNQVANIESSIGCQQREKLRLSTERQLMLPLDRKAQVANIEKSSGFTCTVEVTGKDSAETQVKLILSFQKVFRNIPTLHTFNV